MPLKHLKVLELAGLAPAPSCGMILADFGATVIKIDKINSPESFDVLSNGKKSVALNLKHHIGIEIFKKLSLKSDVLIEPFRKGVMEKLGIGPNVLLAENPKLIYARLSGFGQTGYYSDMAGHDINYLSITGLLSLFGWRGKYPTPPTNYSELSAGSLLCVAGILIGVINRYETGIGQVIDANITESMSYAGSWLTRTQNLAIFGKPRGENWLDGGAHFYDTYETKDSRFMAVGAIEPQFYAELISKLGLSYDDVPQFGAFSDCREKFQEQFKRKTQEEWCNVFDQSDACVTPVLSLSEAAEHRHNKDRASFVTDEEGLIVPKPAPQLGTTPGYTHALECKPLIGEHTVEILRQIGYTDSEMEYFAENDIIQVNNIKGKL